MWRLVSFSFNIAKSSHQKLKKKKKKQFKQNRSTNTGSSTVYLLPRYRSRDQSVTKIVEKIAFQLSLMCYVHMN